MSASPPQESLPIRASKSKTCRQGPEGGLKISITMCDDLQGIVIKLDPNRSLSLFRDPPTLTHDCEIFRI